MHSGYTREEAQSVLSQLGNTVPPPLRLIAYGRLGDGLEDYRKVGEVSTMLFDDLEGVYRQFRKLRPRKRWSLCVFSAHLPVETETEKNPAIFLDTQLYEKATGRWPTK